MSDLTRRKSDHLDLAISGDVGFRRTTLLEEVELLHCSLPELSWDEIEIGTRIAGIPVRSPVMIAAMTGGTSRAGDINLKLAEIAEAGGYAIGLGSQRAMVKTGRIDQAIGESYSLRRAAPTTPIFGNLGVVQAASMPTALVEEMIGFVDANALCLHMNPAQEMIQPEGDRDFRGCLDAIGRLVSQLKVPVIVKETGCGISRVTAERLAQIGVEHVDVSGAGGTSWIAVEALRAEGDMARAGQEFWDWGIPTAGALLQVAPLGFRTVIASGGIKSGLDVARAIALGATATGLARPVLKALDSDGIFGAKQLLSQVEHDLRTAMLLTGSRNLSALSKVRRRLGAELRSWAEV
jgi:isopentenyl-diphosphate delta-isomerase